MCIHTLNSIDTLYNKIDNIRYRIYNYGCELCCCFKKELKRKKSDEIMQILNPYYNPNIYNTNPNIFNPHPNIFNPHTNNHKEDIFELQEDIFELQEVIVIPNKVIEKQPLDLATPLDFGKNPIHKIETNENIKLRNILFKKNLQEDKDEIKHTLSDIPEDITDEALFFENLEEEFKQKMRKPIKIIETDSSDDNWDILT